MFGDNCLSICISYSLKGTSYLNCQFIVSLFIGSDGQDQCLTLKVAFLGASPSVMPRPSVY